MSLLEKLKKNSKVKEAAVLQSSSFFKNTEFISTEVPLINLALSGDVDGGLTSGITTIAGPSKHFKCHEYNEIIEIYTEDPKIIEMFT